MPHFRKKPVIVEAYRLSHNNIETVLAWLNQHDAQATLDSFDTSIFFCDYDAEAWTLHVGDYAVKEGLYIKVYSSEDFAELFDEQIAV